MCFSFLSPIPTLVLTSWGGDEVLLGHVQSCYKGETFNAVVERLGRQHFGVFQNSTATSAYTLLYAESTYM